MKRLLAVTAVLFTVLALPANARAVALGDGTGITFTIDDKIFNDFSCSIIGPIGFASPTDCDFIDVTAQTVGGLEGLQFQAAFFAGFGLPVSLVDVLIGYTVTTLSGDPLITDIHLDFDATANSSIAFANVTETVYQGGTLNQLANIFVQQTNPPLATDTLTASAVFAPQTSIDVTKDIQLAANATGFVQFSFVNQFVSQTAVPEPAALLLLGSGLISLVGLPWMRRRQSRRDG